MDDPTYTYTLFSWQHNHVHLQSYNYYLVAGNKKEEKKKKKEFLIFQFFLYREQKNNEITFFFFFPTFSHQPIWEQKNNKIISNVHFFSHKFIIFYGFL